MKKIWLLASIVISANILITCDAVLIDLNDYILSTGDHYVTPNLAFANRNETTNDYAAIVSFGTEKNEKTIITLLESNNSTNWNIANLTANGFKPVKKPYPGYLKTDATDDSVTYIGNVTNSLSITVLCDSYQEAINLLKNIQVISRMEYQEIKSDELTKELGG